MEALQAHPSEKEHSRVNQWIPNICTPVKRIGVFILFLDCWVSALALRSDVKFHVIIGATPLYLNQISFSSSLIDDVI